MTESRDAVEKDIEAALKRSADRAKRDAQAAGVPLVRRENDKLIKVRIEPDGNETVVEERCLTEE